MRSSADHSSTSAESSETSAECWESQLVCPRHYTQYTVDVRWEAHRISKIYMPGHKLVSLEISFNSNSLPELSAVFAEKNGKLHSVFSYKNVELMHKCSPEHLRMGTLRLKQDKDTWGRRQTEKE